MGSKLKLYAGGGAALVAAAAVGFGLSRLTDRPSPPRPEAPAGEKVEAPDSGGELKEIILSAEAVRSADIEVSTVATDAFEAEVIAPGTVVSTPDGQAVLTARAPGAFTRIYKRLGDPVRAGEPVALVESRDAAQAVADRSVARANVRLAQQTLARERRLYEERVSPRQDYEQAQAAADKALAEERRSLSAATAARVAGDGRSVVVSSPLGGRITSVAAGVGLGAYVQPETELFRVADPRRVQVEASVTASDAGKVAIGDHAIIDVEGREVRVIVRAVTPSVDAQTRAATVVFAVEPGAGLRPGQVVQVSLHSTAQAGPAAIVAPEDAVQTLGERSVVFVRTARGFLPRQVLVGRRNNRRAEVLRGLSAGEVVATRNAFLLKGEIGKTAVGED